MQQQPGASFTYRALDGDGASRNGVLVALDEATAIRTLLQQGLTPVSVTAAVAIDTTRAAAGSAGVGEIGRAHV